MGEECQLPCEAPQPGGLEEEGREVEVSAGGRGRGMRGVIKVVGVYDECPICLLGFAETSGMIILTCGHRICSTCIQLWVNKGNGASGACPYSRQSLTNRDMDRYKDSEDDKSGGGGGGGFVGGSSGGRGGSPRGTHANATA